MTDIDLLDELREHVRFRVATTDDDVDDLVRDALETFLEPVDHDGAPAASGDSLAASAADVVADEVAAHRAEQSTWPATTDCDRLSSAFRDLCRDGVVAREGFTCCTNCGMAEIGGQVDPHEEQHVRGFAFYHEQDLEHAVETGSLLIAYGGFYRDPATSVEPARTAAIGREVVAALRRHGLDVTWDGDIDERIAVTLAWQRRRR